MPRFTIKIQQTSKKQFESQISKLAGKKNLAMLLPVSSAAMESARKGRFPQKMMLVNSVDSKTNMSKFSQNRSAKSTAMSISGVQNSSAAVSMIISGSGKRIIPYAPLPMSASKDEFFGWLNEIFAGQDEQEEQNDAYDNDEDGILAWLEDVVDGVVIATVNAAGNHLDDDDTYDDYYSELGMDDM